MACSVTVVTPHLPDRHEFLAEAVESVVAQTVRPSAHLISVDYDHLGPAHHLNQMFAAARTEWVAILPDDDLFDPDHLETLAAHSENADLVYSWGRFDGRDDPQYRGEFNAFRLARRKDVGIRGVFMCRKSLWEQVGGYDENAATDDHDFLVRCASDGARFVLVRRETWTYRFHTSNVSLAFQQIADGQTPSRPYYLKRFL